MPAKTYTYLLTQSNFIGVSGFSDVSLSTSSQWLKRNWDHLECAKPFSQTDIFPSLPSYGIATQQWQDITPALFSSSKTEQFVDVEMTDFPTMSWARAPSPAVMRSFEWITTNPTESFTLEITFVFPSASCSPNSTVLVSTTTTNNKLTAHLSSQKWQSSICKLTPQTNSLLPGISLQGVTS